MPCDPSIARRFDVKRVQVLFSQHPCVALVEIETHENGPFAWKFYEPKPLEPLLNFLNPEVTELFVYDLNVIDNGCREYGRYKTVIRDDDGEIGTWISDRVEEIV